jgi:excisionase family DNA binding protein
MRHCDTVLATSPPTPVLSTPEVSHILGISIRTVQRRVEAGELRALRKMPGPNGAYLFDPSDVDAYRAARAAEQKQEPALAEQATAGAEAAGQSA